LMSCSVFVTAAGPPPVPPELTDYEEYGIFTYYPTVPEALFLEGEGIPPNHGLELRKALNELTKVTTIVLDSPGGDVYSALNMAGVIHDRSLNTYIPADSNCASACSFMFLAGRDRFSDGKLGVHQFAPAKDRKENSSTSIARAQFTMSDLYAVLSPFDVPDFVIVKMFDTPADEMYYFTNRQLRKINRGMESSVLDQVDKLLGVRDKFVIELAEYLAEQKEEKQLDVTKTEQPTQPIPIPTPVIKSDQLLAEIQNLLNMHGCAAGNTDGVMGANTRSAMMRFGNATGKNIAVWTDKDQQLAALKEIPFPACTVETDRLDRESSPRVADLFPDKILSYFSGVDALADPLSDLTMAEVKSLQEALRSSQCYRGVSTGQLNIETSVALNKARVALNGTPYPSETYSLDRIKSATSYRPSLCERSGMRGNGWNGWWQLYGYECRARTLDELVPKIIYFASNYSTVHFSDALLKPADELLYIKGTPASSNYSKAEMVFHTIQDRRKRKVSSERIDPLRLSLVRTRVNVSEGTFLGCSVRYKRL